MTTCALPPIGEVFAVFLKHATNSQTTPTLNIGDSGQLAVNPPYSESLPDFYQQRPSSFCEQSFHCFTPDVVRVESQGRMHKSRSRKRKQQPPYELPPRRSFQSPTRASIQQFQQQIASVNLSAEDELDNFRPILLTPDDGGYLHKDQNPVMVDLDSGSSEHSQLPYGDLYPVKGDKVVARPFKIRNWLLKIRLSKKRRVIRQPRNLDNDRDVDGALILNLPRNRPAELGVKITKSGRFHRGIITPALRRRFARRPHEFIDLNLVADNLYQNENRLQPVISRILGQKKITLDDVPANYDMVARAVNETLWMLLKIVKPKSSRSSRYTDMSMDRIKEIWYLKGRKLNVALSDQTGHKVFDQPEHFEYDHDTSRIGLLVRAGYTAAAALNRYLLEKTIDFYGHEQTVSANDSKAVMNTLREGSLSRG